jgi:hypothetical protein
VQVFLAVIIIFPLIVAIALKSKYLYQIIALAILNAAALAFDYKKYLQPERQCVGQGLGNCESHFTASLILFTLIVIVSVIMWYLAFKQKENVSGFAANSATRKTLAASGWLIIIVVALIIAFFIFAFSQI